MTSPLPEQEQNRRPKPSIIQSVLSTVVIALFVITFVVQAFQIPSESMEKTLLVGDYLLVDKIHFAQSSLAPRFLPVGNIQRGDIVVFRYPVDPSQHFVKRVIGLPGDHLRLINKAVYIDGNPLKENYALYSEEKDTYRDDFPSARHDFSENTDIHWRSQLERYLSHGELIVPPNEYFVMGDNRDHSLDSRYWGFVPRANIVGRPLIIYLSLRHNSEEESDDAAKPALSSHILTRIWDSARWGRTFSRVH
ncbi:MAG TPA: signal peptidase I [Candidatus Angelobacter sp.]|nr:signal peptidase I [Candidatus Angelobacter sp.]